MVEERVVVIGGGNGIGAACCRLMAQRGWKVVVVDLDADAAKQVAGEIGASAYAADMGDLDALEELGNDIEREQGTVHSLVVAAAVFQNRYSPQDFPMDLWRKVMSVNVEGTFNANKIFGARIAKAGGGSIVNIASAVGSMSSPQHAYGPSKAAVLSLTRNFASEWGRAGVRVNSVSPGATIVPRVLARGPGRYASNIEDHMALGRRVESNEVAEGVEFLASRRASAITGIDLLIDAGWNVASSWGLYGGVPQNSFGAEQ